MIPQRLELTNFLSYRKTTVLDFKGIHLACISGLNGAGKSSILDGMTWALFGKSRSRSDDDVVNRVAGLRGEAAEVRFEFDLEEVRYRVIRRKKPRRSAELELQLQIGPEDGPGRWETLTEAKLRETQSAIEALLRMNYETFTNASFLLQGKADEFTTKTPGKRKEILADLLGVSRWDQYREAAAARRKGEERELLLLDARLGEIDGELQQEDARRQALTLAKAEFDDIAGKLGAMETLLESFRRVAEAVAQQEQVAKRTQQMLIRQQDGLARLEKSLAEREVEKEEKTAILQNKETIRNAYAAYEIADAQWQVWQGKADQYNALQQMRRPHELKLERIRSGLEQQEKALRQQSERIQRMKSEQAVLQKERLETGEQLTKLTAELATLTQQEQAWHEARAALQALEGERRLLQKELAGRLVEGSRIADLAHEQVAVSQNLQQAMTALTDADLRVEALTEQRRQHAGLLAERDNLRSEQPRLREEMDALSERISRLKKETGGSCPLCGQELSEAHRQQVLAELERDGQKRGDLFRANQARISECLEEIGGLEKSLKAAGRLEQDQKVQQQRGATAQARLDEIARQIAAWEEEGQPRKTALEAVLADDGELQERQRAVAALALAVQDKERLESERATTERLIAKTDARLAEIDRVLTTWEQEQSVEWVQIGQRLENGEFDVSAQAALADLKQQIVALNYDSEAHQAARDERERWSEAPARYQALKQAEAAINQLARSLKELGEQTATQREHVAELSRQLEETNAQLALLNAGGGDLQATESEVLALRERKAVANRRIGAAQQLLAVLDTLRAQQGQLTEERAERTLVIQRLERLEKACGRDGVQALLIEQALPEIESDANELLERLTGGDMRVIFDTQRQLKSRDALAETLDIRISDAGGERPYENFSGGEQFRVNFAIRLALSRILARRAGARLQTLVIDEGFGSQDPAGRQRLVEVINTIQDGFARILVITHVDEMRDVFPSRIEVSKERTGSTISLR